MKCSRNHKDSFFSFFHFLISYGDKYPRGADQTIKIQAKHKTPIKTNQQFFLRLAQTNKTGKKPQKNKKKHKN